VGEAAESAARAGLHEVARRLADQGIAFEECRGTFVELARAAMREDPSRAVHLATTLPGYRMELSVAIADQLARAGHREQAVRLLNHVERVARSIRDPNWEDATLCDVTSSVARSGHPERAESLARAVGGPGRRAWALAAVAEAWGTSGNREQAERLAAEAEEMARGARHHGASALAKLAAVAAEAGQLDRAVTMARTIDDEVERARALEAVVACGAVGVLVEIEEIAHSATDSYSHAEIHTALARALVAADEWDRSEQVAHEIENPRGRMRALAATARAMARTGQAERARALALDAERLALQAARHDDDPWLAIVDVVSALARAGDVNRAEELARTIPYDSSFERASALVSIVEAVGLPQGNHLLAEAFAVGRWVPALTALATLRPELAVPIADAAFDYR